jgi:hypothetical protein
MNQAIGDKAAIEFAVSFYDAIGAGRDVPFAFELAKNAIQLAGIPEHLTPVLRSTPTPQPTATAKPPGKPATSQLTPGQQRRLEQQRSSLQAEWELRSEKLQRLRQSRSIEAATAIQFQLDQQIETETTKLRELEQELDRLEQQLDS